MSDLTIETNRKYGEVDLVFFPDTDNGDLLDDLHDNVTRMVSGISTKRGVRDAVVAVRKYDFDDVVDRLANVYRERGFKITIRSQEGPLA